MTLFDCGSDMARFHDDEITLSKCGRDEMRARRDAGRRRLEIGLEVECHPQAKITCSQGSYAMWSMVQDRDNDYDIDDGIYFDEVDLVDDQGRLLSPQQAKERICTALSRDKRFAQAAVVLANCVRQVYSEGYHIDMPVYRIVKRDDGQGGACDVFELASNEDWVMSDARSTTRWFRDEVATRNARRAGEGDQMRRVVRLSKGFSRSGEGWKEKTTSGIVITKLVVDHFVGSEERDDEALLATWKAIRVHLDVTTRVNHPVNSTDLAEEGNAKVLFFRGKLSWALEELAILEGGCTRVEARDTWDKVFHSGYFGALPDPEKAEAKKAFFIDTGSRTETRNDGNGRFG